MAQFGRPSSDITVGVWTTTPLWEKLDEVTPDDTTTEITAPSVGSGLQDFEVKLTAVTDPGIHTGHVIKVRMRKSAAAGKNISVTPRLFQGTTNITPSGVPSTNLTENYVTITYTLTEAQAADITDYSDLRIRPGATWASGGAGRDAFCTWVELEVPDSSTDRRGQVSWAEVEVPTAPRRAEVSWAEVEVPTAPRRAEVSWSEFELPTAPRRGQVSFQELEFPDAPRRGQVSWGELQVPDKARALVSWSELEVPEAAQRRAQVAWSEFEMPTAPRRAQVSFSEFELPTAPRRALVSFAELEAPLSPRRAFVSFAELQVPDVGGPSEPESTMYWYKHSNPY